jgi:serine protease Do
MAARIRLHKYTLCLVILQFVFVLADAGAEEKKTPLPLPSVADVVETALAAVVGITNSRSSIDSGADVNQSSSLFQEGPHLSEQTLMGSGVILKPEGLIVTNHHILEGAQTVVVKLVSGESYPAKVIGTDARTDIALVKMAAPRSLPFLSLGRSNEVRVGDWVIAIGGLPGLQQTVTLGIVSAKGRDIGIGSDDEYIQTDAALTLGLSGGPLLNLQGEVVGINTAVATQEGMFLNVGFALPSDQLRFLIPRLEESGRVTRGYLGILVQEMTVELASFLGVESAQGAIVTSVIPGGPAARAGLRRGDVVVTYDKEPIASRHILTNLIAQSPIGKRVAIRLVRWRKLITVSAVVGAEPDEEANLAKVKEESRWGFAAMELTSREQGERAAPAKGVAVATVVPAGPAALAGLRQGDRIVEVNRQLVKSLADLERFLTTEKEAVLVFVQREEGGRFLMLRWPEKAYTPERQ